MCHMPNSYIFYLEGIDISKSNLQVINYILRINGLKRNTVEAREYICTVVFLSYYRVFVCDMCIYAHVWNSEDHLRDWFSPSTPRALRGLEAGSQNG